MKKPVFTHTAALGIIMAASFPAIAQTNPANGNENSRVYGASANNPSNISPSNINSWDSQNEYWRGNYSKRPYYNSSVDYSNYEPAYRYGTDLYNQNRGLSYSELNQEKLRSGWSQARGNSGMSWEDAQAATRDAYNHLSEINAMGGKENIRSGTSSSGASGGTLGAVGTGSNK